MNENGSKYAFHSVDSSVCQSLLLSSTAKNKVGWHASSVDPFVTRAAFIVSYTVK